MKYRESGMPEENMWNTFFEPENIIKSLEIEDINTLIDIGCGYGTFLFPISKKVKLVIGIDIDKEMTEYCRKKAIENKIENIEIIDGDIIELSKSSLKKYTGSVEYITMFNILHCEEPVKLLQTAFELLKPEGRIGIIHWKYEKTPRGPSMEIRPRPEQILEWGKEAGLKPVKEIELPPYHYGIILKK